jgi:hypothetical protein
MMLPLPDRELGQLWSAGSSVANHLAKRAIGWGRMTVILSR